MTGVACFAYHVAHEAYRAVPLPVGPAAYVRVLFHGAQVVAYGAGTVLYGVSTQLLVVLLVLVLVLVLLVQLLLVEDVVDELVDCGA